MNDMLYPFIASEEFKTPVGEPTKFVFGNSTKKELPIDLIVPEWVDDEETLKDKEYAMRTEKIIDLYVKKATEAFETAYKNAVDELLERDEVIKLIHFTMINLNNNVKNHNSEAPEITVHLPLITYATNETKKQNYKICEARAKEADELVKLIDEVKTMVQACDSYDKELSVLKSYEIIGTSGKLKTYIPKFAKANK